MADSEKPVDPPGAAVMQRVAEATFRCAQPVSTVAKNWGRTQTIAQHGAPGLRSMTAYLLVEGFALF